MRDDNSAGYLRFLIGACLSTILLFAAGGTLLYRHEAREIRSAKLAELQAIAHLKADQLTSWRRQRLTDVQLNSSGIVRELVNHWLRNPGSSGTKTAILKRLKEFREAQGYRNILLTSPEGKIWLALEPHATALAPEARAWVEQAVRSRRSLLGDFSRCPSYGEVALDAIAPVLDDGSRPVAALLLLSDLDQVFYPLIMSWPTPSPSAETLLIRREGDSVLFLNKLRHAPDAPLTKRIPLSDTGVPAVQAALGRTGVYDGPDYRGVPVLADLRPIPGSPWFMVTKVDAAELLADIRYRGGAIMIVCCLGILMAAGLALLYYNIRQRRLYADIARAERKRHEAQDETRAALYGIGDGVISTDREGRVTRVNPEAARLTGWAEAEALGRPLEEVFNILNETTRAKVENPAARVLREGRVVGLANHTMLIAKDGTEFPIADSGAPILGPQGDVVGMVLVFRDQTDERAATLRLEESAARMHSLLEIFQHDSRNQQDFLDFALHEALKLTQSRLGYIYFYHEDRRQFVLNTWSKGVMEQCSVREPQTVYDLDKTGIWGEAVRQKKPIILNDFKAAHPLKKGYPEGHAELHRFMTIPVLSGERIVAVVGVANKETDYSEADSLQLTLLMGSVWSVIERRQAQEAMHGSEVRYRRLFEAALDGILILDAGTGRILDANPFLATLLGYSSEELMSKSVWEVGALKDLVANQDQFRELQEKGRIRYEHLPLQTRSGQRVDVEFVSNVYDMDGRKVIQCNIREITARVRAEQDARDALQRQDVLNAMLQHSLSVIPLQHKLVQHLSCLLTVPWLDIEPKGTIFLLTKGGRTLTMTVQQGLSPEVQRACAELPLGKCLCGRAAQNGEMVIADCIGADHEVRYDGMAPHGHCCAPIKADGKTLGVLNLYLKPGAALDQKQQNFIKAATAIMAENIVHSQTEGELAQSQKMESVGRLAGGVAHDFNNLLTAINGYAQFLLDALPAKDPKREDVKEILSAGDRAAGLTRQLLAFSRRQILDPKILDLNGAIGAFLKILQRLIGEDIRLETRLFPKPCMVKVDTGQMDQVLLNLAVNARDAMPKGGMLSLQTDVVSGDTSLAAINPDLGRGPLVRLTVSDTGSGMTDEVLAHLFEPFYTTKEPGKGTGLGLATVYGIIKQSGGDILVESVAGEGTTFRIYLHEEMVAAAAQESDPARGEGPQGTETILVVEDEELIRRLIARTLAKHGYTVISAMNGDQALQLLGERAKPVDLIISDVVMPGMSGRDMAREASRRGFTRRVLYMSGYTDAAIITHGVLEPGLEFIYKPFSPESLMRKLREVLAKPEDQTRI